MATYILLSQDFKSQSTVLEGYFSSIKQAKKYIEENELFEDDFQLYKLESNKDYLQ